MQPLPSWIGGASERQRRALETSVARQRASSNRCDKQSRLFARTHRRTRLVESVRPNASSTTRPAL